MERKNRLISYGWALLMLCMGCEGRAIQGDLGPAAPGDFVQPSGDPSAPDACMGVTVAASPASLRRLNVTEQTNSFRDILSDASLTPDLAPMSDLTMTEVEVEKLNLAVASMVNGGKHLTFLPCSSTGSFNTTCADTFIAEFGKMAFRRPLLPEEKTWLRQEVFDAIRDNTELSPRATFREAIDAVAQAVLQAPEFVYLNKVGVADASLPPGVRRLTGFERAAHLSFLFWGSTPDKALLTAAEQGTLDTPEGVRTEASRLLSSPRAETAIRSFVSNWLQLNGNSHQASLETAPKSATAFPFDSPALRAAMREEVQSLYEDTFFGAGASFRSLMTSRRAYVNKSLGQLYGVSSPPTSDSTYAWVDLNPAERAGLFTRSAFLMLYSPQSDKSPIRRGVFVYRDALCQPLGAPPANVQNIPVPPADHARTVREVIEARTADTTCQGCHARINPLGFSFENYDPMGRFQTTEVASYNGTNTTLPVNSTATPVGTDFNTQVSGGVDLSQKLAESGMARDCMATVWFERANERALTSADACSLQKAMRGLRASDDMRDLVLNIASDDSALFILEAQ